MAINLQKGQRVSLDNSLKLALVGLGWDTNRYDGGFDFDLDASVFLLGENRMIPFFRFSFSYKCLHSVKEGHAFVIRQKRNRLSAFVLRMPVPLVSLDVHTVMLFQYVLVSAPLDIVSVQLQIGHKVHAVSLRDLFFRISAHLVSPSFSF